MSLQISSAAKDIQEEQELHRAVEAYRFFYPTVSAEGIFNGGRELGIEDGKSLMVLSARPHHVMFTANSDTPYASGVLDLGTMGPVVVEVPAGPYVGLVDDHHQRWILDLGLPGPDGGRGGSYLVLPPGYAGPVPSGYYVGRSSTHKALLAMRALPLEGDVRGAVDALRRVKVYPLDAYDVLSYVDVTDRALDGTCLRWEGNLELWKRLHAIIDAEPPLVEFRPMYGELAALGIEKGKRFAPDKRMRRILERAAKAGLEQMRVEAFASERPERIVWRDRTWEWVGLVTNDPNFETRSYLDLEARDRWFFQAIVTSPAMFRRQVGAGSLYFLAARDADGEYLDGGKSYVLSVPLPVPASLFWSVTAYDARTRSQVRTPQDRAVLSSLFDDLASRSANASGVAHLYFGPTAPPGSRENEPRWIQTEPGTSFFLYFRIYGPEAASLDGTWKLGDVARLERAASATGTSRSISEETLGSISTPTAIETRAGVLHFADGVPSPDTVAKIYDNLDFTHAVEAFMNAYQAASLWAMREGFRDAGVEDDDVLLFPRLVDSRSLFLTASCDTIYFSSFLDLSNGPVIVDVPPQVLGVVDDMWFRWVTDFGMAGPDRGEGGSYLIVPPGYAGPLPEGGCYVARASTTHAAVLGRAFLEDDDPSPAVARIKRGLAIHPYEPGGRGSSVASFLAGKGAFGPLASRRETRFIEGTGLPINTIPPNDPSFFDMLDAMVQLEPAEALDPEIAGQLAAIGIVKGRPFRPDARMKHVLAEAIAVANATSRAISFSPRESEGFRFYDRGSAWMNPLFVGGYDFSRPPPLVTNGGVEPFPERGARLLHARTSFFYMATGVTPAMCMRLTRIGSQYLAAFVDATGDQLWGERTYELVLPPKIPAETCWSITVYDNQTRSMLQTEQRYPRAGSQSYPTPAAAPDEDGSISLYFGPERPHGVREGNWIETVPDKGWFAILRLYGPRESFFDKTWRPGEIEEVTLRRAR